MLKSTDHPFELALLVPAEDIIFELRGYAAVAWADFLLNPRRLRGSDFLMRWSQGVWSEHQLIKAVKARGEYFALPYGPSGVAPDDDVREYELYFERLEAAGLGSIKRPDLLIMRKRDEEKVENILRRLGGAEELPFISEEDDRISQLLRMAIVAVECENSLWRARQMPDFGAELKPQKRLGGQLGLKKSAVLPTVIIKEEDREPLREWQSKRHVPIHIWHAFFDLAFGLPLDRADDLIQSGAIEPTVQVFQAPGGATTKKAIYKFYYHYAYSLGKATEEPQLKAQCLTDKNGHVLPYVTFEGGRFELRSEALDVLRELSR